MCVVGGVRGWEGGNLLLLQILVVSATHTCTHSVQTSVSAWAFPHIPRVQNHLQRRAPCVLARPQHLSAPRLCLRHGSEIIGSYSLLQGGQLGTKNNQVKLHAADVWMDGGDEDTLRIDVSFAEGIADDEALQSAVEGDALLMLKSALNPNADLDFDEEAELSILLCKDEYIQGLNQQYRSKNAPTDVLSFPQEEENGILGDLVISLDTAQRQADERKHDLKTELRILMVHGLLHLLGYDHETCQEDLEEMSDAETRLLKRLGWEGSGLITSVGFESVS